MVPLQHYSDLRLSQGDKPRPDLQEGPHPPCFISHVLGKIPTQGTRPDPTCRSNSALQPWPCPAALPCDAHSMLDMSGDWLRICLPHSTQHFQLHSRSGSLINCNNSDQSKPARVSPHYNYIQRFNIRCSFFVSLYWKMLPWMTMWWLKTSDEQVQP